MKTLLLIIMNILYNIYTHITYFCVCIIGFINNDNYYDIELSYNKTINTIHTQTQCMLCDIGWKYCELLTLLNIIYKTNILPSFHKITNDYFRYSILLIKNGNEIKYLKDKASLQLNNNINYDLLFYTNYSNNDSKKNYTIISEKEPLKHTLSNINICSVTFIVFQIIIDEDKYDINLKEPYNF